MEIKSLINMIIKSQNIEGTLTHNVPNPYVKRVLNGKFRIYKSLSKPNGIWVSWNYGWEHFCEFNFNEKIENVTQFEVKLFKNLNILIINGLTDLLNYWQQFSDKTIPSYNYNLEKLNQINNFWNYLKSKNIDGIGLTNDGVQSTRNTFLYSWDCESIVIFNPSNIILKHTENKNGNY